MCELKSVTLKSLGGGKRLNSIDEPTQVVGNFTATYEICVEKCGCCGPNAMINRALEAVGSPNNPGPHQLPAFGSQYPPPECTGEDAFFAYVTGYQPGETTEKNNDCCTRVVVSYQSRTFDPVPLGQDDPNPLNWCPEITITGFTEDEEATHAIFEGGWIDTGQVSCEVCDNAGNLNDVGPPAGDLVDINNPCVTMNKGDCVRIQNTAGQDFLPPPTRKSSKKRVRITRYVAAYDPAGVFPCHENTVNCDPVVIDIPCRNFTATFPAGTLFLGTIDGQTQTRTYQDGTGADITLDYYAITYDLEYCPKGYAIDIINEGFYECNSCGDPEENKILLDGDGNRVPAGGNVRRLRFSVEECSNLNNPALGLV